MANDLGELVVSIKADTSGVAVGMEVAQKATEKLVHAVESVGAVKGFEFLVEGLKGALEHASEAEVNVRRLNAAVSDQTDVAKFQELAAALAKVTTFSDDASLSALTLLNNFNLTDRQMAQTLPRIQNFAAATGRDLDSAAQAFGKAVANGKVALRGLGIGFNDAQKEAFQLANEQGRVSILLDQIDSKMPGVAQAVGDTGAGAFKRATNAGEELSESFGRLIDGPASVIFGTMARVIQGLADALDHASDNTKFWITVLGGLAVSFGIVTAGILAASKAFEFFGGAKAIVTALTSPLGMIAALAATATAAIVTLYGAIQRFRESGKFTGLDFAENFKRGTIDFGNEIKRLLDELSAPEVGAGGDKAKVPTPDDFNHKKKGGDDINFGQVGVGAQFGIGDPEGMKAARQQAWKNVRAGLGALDPKLVEGFDVGLKQFASKLGTVGSELYDLKEGLASGDPAQALATIAVDLLSRTSSFKTVQATLEKTMDQTAAALDPALRVFAVYMTSMNNWLRPVMAVLKFVADAMAVYYKTLIEVQNGILEVIAQLASMLPFIGDDIANWIRQAKMDTSGFDDLSDSTKDLTKSFSDLNVPVGFKKDALVFASMDAGQRAASSGGGTTTSNGPGAIPASSMPDLGDVFKAIGQKFLDGFNAVARTITSPIADFFSWFASGLWSGITGVISSIGGLFSSLGLSIFNGIKNMIGGIVSGITGILGPVASSIAGFVSAISKGDVTGAGKALGNMALGVAGGTFSAAVSPITGTLGALGIRSATGVNTRSDTTSGTNVTIQSVQVTATDLDQLIADLADKGKLAAANRTGIASSSPGGSRLYYGK